MIIYGWKATNLKQAPLPNRECPHCGQKNSVIAFFAHYAHIFWIPLFPYKKSASIVCLSCQLTTNEKEMTGETRSQVKQLKSAVSMPKWTFIGLAVIVVGIALIAFNDRKQGETELIYATNPEPGDVYVLKDDKATNEYKYYLWKVRDVQEDSLYVSINAFVYNKLPYKLENKDGFYDVYYAVHRGEIASMYKAGDIKTIKRDYSATSGFDQELVYEFTEEEQDNSR